MMQSQANNWTWFRVEKLTWFKSHTGGRKIRDTCRGKSRGLIDKIQATFRFLNFTAHIFLTHNSAMACIIF
jgi:hypothetical protein